MTRLLLDTHLVLWWLSDDPRLPQPVLERLQGRVPFRGVKPEARMP